MKYFNISIFKKTWFCRSLSLVKLSQPVQISVPFLLPHLPISLKNRYLPVILIRIIRSDQCPALGSRRYHKEPVAPCTDNPVPFWKRIPGRACSRRIFGQQKFCLFDTLDKMVMFRRIADIKSVSEKRDCVAAFFQTVCAYESIPFAVPLIMAEEGVVYFSGRAVAVYLSFCVQRLVPMIAIPS